MLVYKCMSIRDIHFTTDHHFFSSSPSFLRLPLFPRGMAM
uniref:Uncharacterized protein n=1 Tax=Anguilla anguilla TaxID=7936 RepID=A0A0E9VPP8_ANGAN